MLFTRNGSCQFEIKTDDPGLASWGYAITVRLPAKPGELQEVEHHYRLGQSYGLNTGYYCTWELSEMEERDHVLLNGRLVVGRTDPFAPLMKCLAFLEAKHGGEE